MLLSTVLLTATVGTLTLTTTRSDGADRSAAKIATLEHEAASLRTQLAAARRAARAAVRRPRPVPKRRDDVRHALRIAASAYGVSESKLRRVATCESTLNANARNGQYHGLFQFGLPLWKKTPYGRFSRTDPYAASLAAAWAFKRGMARNWPVCGYR